MTRDAAYPLLLRQTTYCDVLECVFIDSSYEPLEFELSSANAMCLIPVYLGEGDGAIREEGLGGRPTALVAES
jgi:hypothetical protein